MHLCIQDRSNKLERFSRLAFISQLKTAYRLICSLYHLRGGLLQEPPAETTTQLQ